MLSQTGDKARVSKPKDSQKVSASQARRQRDNELAEIDEEMDKLVAEMSADFDSVDEEKSLSPTQPVLLS